MSIDAGRRRTPNVSKGPITPLANYEDSAGMLRRRKAARSPLRMRFGNNAKRCPGIFATAMKRPPTNWLCALWPACDGRVLQKQTAVEKRMTYASISNWTTTEWNNELEAVARDKFVPLIMSVGALRVQMIRTGDLSFSVMTEYADEATAIAAQAKIADIRAQASGELPMSMSSAAAGGIFAAG
jgi:hypothetical protein